MNIAFAGFRHSHILGLYKTAAENPAVNILYCYEKDAAAKEGIRGLSRVAATEWAKDGINTNVVCPLAWTAQLENFQNAYPDAFKENVKMPPAGHYGDAELEIGRVCAVGIS